MKKIGILVLVGSLSLGSNAFAQTGDSMKTKPTIDLLPGAALTQKLSVALAVLLIVGYGLGLLFSLKTHQEIFSGAEHAEAGEPAWPIGLALFTLAIVTILVALVSEIFVESVQKAAETFGMSQAFVGFIVVALVGAAAEMAVAFSAARAAYDKGGRSEDVQLSCPVSVVIIGTSDSFPVCCCNHALGVLTDLVQTL